VLRRVMPLCVIPVYATEHRLTQKRQQRQPSPLWFVIPQRSGGICFCPCRVPHPSDWTNGGGSRTSTLRINPSHASSFWRSPHAPSFWRSQNLRIGPCRCLFFSVVCSCCHPECVFPVRRIPTKLGPPQHSTPFSHKIPPLPLPTDGRSILIPHNS
jgi:hypothetical protein